PCRKALVERNQRLIPSEGSREGRGEQRAPQAAAASGDLALSFMLSAIGIEGSQPGESCGFLTADATELGHADDDRQRSALADAGDAEHQLEPLGQVVVGTKALGEVTHLRSLAYLQPVEVAVDDASQRGLDDVLETGLEAPDVFLDLVEKGQI